MNSKPSSVCRRLEHSAFNGRGDRQLEGHTNPTGRAEAVKPYLSVILTSRAHGCAFIFGSDDIAARNYNLDIKNPHVGEQISHDPEKLLKRYQEQQQDIQSLRDQLKGILAAALTGAQ